MRSHPITRRGFMCGGAAMVVLLSVPLAGSVASARAELTVVERLHTRTVLPASVVDLATSEGGTFYVLAGARVVKLSRQGAVLGSWGNPDAMSESSAAGEFSRPQQLALGEDGSVYVADFGNRRVQRFSADGALLGMWGASGPDAFDEVGPLGVATDATGTVFSGDRTRGVMRFDAGGAFTGSIAGSVAGHMAADDGGFLYVAIAHGLMRYATDGSTRQALPRLRFYGGSPADVTVDGSGAVWATDPGAERVVRGDMGDGFGRLLGECGGGNPGAVDDPQAVARAGDNDVWVANSNDLVRIGERVDPAHPCDRIAPRLGFLRRPARTTTRRRFRSARRSPVVTLTSSEPGRIAIRLVAVKQPRRGHCQTAPLVFPGCLRRVAGAYWSAVEPNAGAAVRIRLRAGRKLAPGTYFLRVSAVDAVGNRARPVFRRLKVQP
jgi:sugar lactone lactonase YvrE